MLAGLPYDIDRLPLTPQLFDQILSIVHHKFHNSTASSSLSSSGSSSEQPIGPVDGGIMATKQLNSIKSLTLIKKLISNKRDASANGDSSGDTQHFIQVARQLTKKDQHLLDPNPHFCCWVLHSIQFHQLFHQPFHQLFHLDSC